MTISKKSPTRPSRCLVLLVLLGAPACATAWFRTAMLSRPPLATLQRGEALIGAPVADERRKPMGTIADFLIEPVTGEVVGVAVSLRPAGSSRGEAILEYGSIDWTAGAHAAPVPNFDGRAGDLAPDRAAYSELFGGRATSSVTGVIADDGHARAGAGAPLILKIRDDENLLLRVLVDPGHLVARCLSLSPGQSVKAEGVLTRDATGKLLVASSLEQDGAKLVFRDASGAILWDALAERFQTARALRGGSVLAADGSPLSITGWVLDLALGQVRYLVVRGDGVDRVVGWNEVDRAAGSRAWRVLHDTAQLSGSPAAAPDGPIEAGL